MPDRPIEVRKSSVIWRAARAPQLSMPLLALLHEPDDLSKQGREDRQT